MKKLDIENWYERYADELFTYGMAFSLDRETVLDAIQDLFLHLYEAKTHLQEPTNVKLYLLGALKNRLISLKRKEVAFQELTTNSDYDFQIKIDAQDLIEDEEERKSYEKQIQDLLNLLTAKQKEVIYLHYMQELSYEEIAIILHITPKSVRKITYRALERMQQAVNPSLYIFIFHLLNSVN